MYCVAFRSGYLVLLHLEMSLCSQNTERTAFDDEAELKRERKAKRAAEEQERFRGMLQAIDPLPRLSTSLLHI